MITALKNFVKEYWELFKESRGMRNALKNPLELSFDFGGGCPDCDTARQFEWREYTNMESEEVTCFCDDECGYPDHSCACCELSSAKWDYILAEYYPNALNAGSQGAEEHVSDNT